MKSQILFIVLMLLVFTTPINCGEKLNDIVSKYYERRATGILAQPRVGRTNIAGLVHYPRVGRSGVSSSFNNLNHDIPIEYEEMMDLNSRKSQLASLMNHIYQKYPYNNGEGKQRRQFKSFTKRRWWMSVGQIRHGTMRKDQEPLRLYHCSNCEIERTWVSLFAPSEDSVQLEGQLAHNYVPRFTGEINHAQRNIILSNPLDFPEETIKVQLHSI